MQIKVKLTGATKVKEGERERKGQVGRTGVGKMHSAYSICPTKTFND